MKRDLDNWQPIQTMPTNRIILLYYPDFGQVTSNIRKFIEFKKQMISPTHWQELPEDPEDPDIFIEDLIAPLD